MTAAFLFQVLIICSFAALCEAAAQDYALGYVDVVDAADRLQDYAIGRGLVSDFGQDSVQGIMAAAFAAVRRQEHANDYWPEAGSQPRVAKPMLNAAGYLIRQNNPQRLATDYQSITTDRPLTHALAERQGTSVYAALQRSVETGIAALANRPAHDKTSREIVGELASVSTRLVDVERMLDRALFTACAAYCYARSARQRAPAKAVTSSSPRSTRPITASGGCRRRNSYEPVP